MIPQAGNRPPSASRSRSSVRPRGESGSRGLWKGAALSSQGDSTGHLPSVDSTTNDAIEVSDGSGGSALENRGRGRSLALKGEVPFLSGFGIGGNVRAYSAESRHDSVDIGILVIANEIIPLLRLRIGGVLCCPWLCILGVRLYL